MRSLYRCICHTVKSLPQFLRLADIPLSSTPFPSKSVATVRAGTYRTHQGRVSACRGGGIYA
jgi:hypothetical protein